jgi:hypothetical protein
MATPNDGQLMGKRPSTPSLSQEGAYPMPTSLVLNDFEARLLQEILKGDLRRLLSEIAHTDHRGMKAGLKAREVLLQGILRQLNAEE